MNIKYCIAMVVIGMLLAIGVQAKTFKYEIQEMNSSGTGLDYPGLDLNGATSGAITIEQASPSEPAILTSLEINFPFAANLSTKAFSEHDNVFRTSVNRAWVYRQLNVEIHGFDIAFPNDQFVNIDTYVSEGDGFLNDNQPIGLGQPLFNASGRLVDVTPSQVVDTKTLTVDGSKLKLALINQVISVPERGLESAIVIDSLWFGRGEEKLYIAVNAPNDVSKFYKPYRIAITTIPGPNEEENLIRIFAKNEVNGEFETEEFPLQALLDQAYPVSR